MWWNWRTWWNCGIKKNTMINEWKQYSRKTINESMTFIASLMDFRCGLTGQIGAFANSPVVVESRFGPARSRWWLRYRFDPATFQETDLVFDPFSSVDPHVKQNELCVTFSPCPSISTFLMESRCPLLSLLFHSPPLAMLHLAPRQGEGQSCEGSTKDTRAHLSVGHQTIKHSWLYRGLN